MNVKCILMSLFVWASTVQAQTYYYYKGKKIGIALDSTKCTIFRDTPPLLLRSAGSDIGKNWNVVEKDSIKILQARNSSLPSDILVIEPVLFPSETPVSRLFYVKLKSECDTLFLKTFAEENGCKVERQVKQMPLWYALSTSLHSAGNSIEMSNRCFEAGRVADVDPGFMFDFLPNCIDEPAWNTNSLWNLQAINCCDAWDITKGDSNIVVAVLDTGVDPNHVELPRVLDGYDAMTGGKTNVYYKVDANHSKYIKYHGTIVAGMIAAAQNGKYTSGISPNVTLLPISHNLESSETLSEELATGISWAWRNGAHIINNSWGDRAGVYYDVLHSALLEEAIHDAMNEGRNGFGSIVTFASGNHNSINYPAYANDSIICVGSINQSFQWFEGSGYGEKLDVVAPGGQLLGTVPWYEGNVYPDASGTSFACPHVSGLAALMLTVNPLLNVEQLQATIDSTCVKLDGSGYGITYPYGSWNSKTGYGLIDAGRAVQAAKDLLPQLKVSEIIRYNDRRVGGWVILDVMGLKVPEICDVEWTIANQDMCNIESYTVEMVGREYFIMEIKGNGLGVIPPFDVEAKYVMNGNVPSTKIIGGGGKKEVYSMRAHVPIGFSLPYYSLEGNIVSQELTIKKSIKGTKEKVGDVSSLRVEIYSLQNKVKTVEVDPLSKEIKISVSDLPDGNYILNMVEAGRVVFTDRIIIKKY